MAEEKFSKRLKKVLETRSEAAMEEADVVETMDDDRDDSFEHGRQVAELLRKGRVFFAEGRRGYATFYLAAASEDEAVKRAEGWLEDEAFEDFVAEREEEAARKRALERA